ncbi:hypothetical protein [Azospirillum sp.]|uniref:hypothetical protein n=1 Tax=Azospirillum sp. TaxID=34012 RepID=UPI002D718FAF|nr:hypothetical protein [Azospirillum sp.]HYD70708.1 hypothetical protein [Azospirillum sp.]
MGSDRIHGDQRDEPLDFRDTRRGKSVDEEKGGFQNVEGPGADPSERAIGSAPGSEEARALDRGEEAENLDVGPGVDSATTGSPQAPTTGAGKGTGNR